MLCGFVDSCPSRNWSHTSYCIFAVIYLSNPYEQKDFVDLPRIAAEKNGLSPRIARPPSLARCVYFTRFLIFRHDFKPSNHNQWKSAAIMYCSNNALISKNDWIELLLFRKWSQYKESYWQPSCWDHLETLSYMLTLRWKSLGCYPQTTWYFC